MQLILLALAWMLAAPATDRSQDDVLGDIVVQPPEDSPQGPRLMRIAVQIEGSGPSHALLDRVVRRDLDLSGQFVVTEDAPAARVRIAIGKGDVGKVEVTASVFLDPHGDEAAYETSVTTPFGALRDTTHRLVDDLIGVLTGYRGPFFSRLTFVVNHGPTRTAYIMDPDGHGLRRITDETALAGAIALGPGDEVYYSASRNRGRYRVYRRGRAEPFDIDPAASVYGLAFSPDRTQVALTMGVGSNVVLFVGRSDFTKLRRFGKLSLTHSPAWSERGKLAVAGSMDLRPRIWVDGRAVSPRGLSATSPDFCEHPDRTRLVYTLGARRRSDIVVARPNGRNARRVTRGAGRDSHPACSPDGRLIAFFSEGHRGQGPGLYIMRIDGYELHKIASVRGDSLQWARRTDADDARPHSLR